MCVCGRGGCFSKGQELFLFTFFAAYIVPQNVGVVPDPWSFNKYAA